RLANALDAQLTAAEARRAERASHPDAMDLVFQGKAWWNKGLTPECMFYARQFFERASVLDPGNIEAMVGLALVDTSTAGSLLTDDSAKAFSAAETTLTKVLSSRPNHAFARNVLGVVRMYTRGPEEGIAECERALALDHNLAGAHSSIGWGKYLLGRG